MKTHLLLIAALTLTAPAMAYYPDTGDGKNPAERMLTTDPLEVERKESSFWWRPSEKTPEAQLARARAYEAEGRLRKARNAYNDLVHEWHSSPQAVTAQLAIASIYEKQEAWQDAYDENIYLLAHFSGQFPLEPVLDKTFRLANLLAENNRGWFGIDLSGPTALRQNYERILHFAPRWSRAAETLLRIGALYEAEGYYTRAFNTYVKILVSFSDTPLRNDVVYRSNETLLKMARNESQDSEKLRECENLIALSIRNNPLHPSVPLFESWKEEINAMRRTLAYSQAKFYDTRQHSIDAARRAYRKFLLDFPSAPQAQEVNARLIELDRAAVK